MNKNNIFKIIFALAIVANIMLIINKFVWPTIRNNELEKEFAKRLQEESKVNEESSFEEQSNATNETYNEYKEISNLDEAEKIEAYVGKYIKYIENKEYEEAYNLLYSGFREKNFKTLDEFKIYCENTYHKSMYLNFGQVYRYGYYYFVDVTIGDFENIGEEDDKKINTAFAVTEKDILDFTISFGL